MPIDPKLYKLLQDRFDELEEGEDRLVKLRGGCIRRNLDKIVTRSGVAPWPKLFQTLRASCEKEWAMKHPQAAVSQWIGHSLTTSGKHYVNGTLPDEVYDKAAGLPSEKAAQNPAQYPVESSGKASQDEKSTIATISHNFATDSILAQTQTTTQVEAGGIEPPSRDHFNDGLYMFSRFFNLNAGDENRHPSPASSRLNLGPKATADSGT